jgi:acetyl/propionyl-CoA carboxylase alpha subunit
MVTGLDLVELQVRVAAGEPLPLRQEDVRFQGHAIEFRINAEDPWDNFKPGGGRVTLCEDAVERCDTGFERGDVVPTQYDSLLAKAIFHRLDRASAFDAAAEQIPHVIQGNFATNAVLQAALAESASFREGDVTIDWLESHLEAVLEAGRAPIEAWVAAAAALSRPTLELLGGRKWPFPGTRWLGAGPAVLWLNDQTTSRAVIVERAETGHGTATVEGVEVAFHDDGHDVLVGRPSEAFDAVELSDMRAVYGAHVTPCIRRGVAGKGRNFVLVPPPPLPRRAPAAEEGATAIVAPLAGTVAMVKVAEGDDVAPGDLLLVLDAMKMEHRITAPAAGRVKAVHVRTGDTVREGDLLVDIG